MTAMEAIEGNNSTIKTGIWLKGVESPKCQYVITSFYNYLYKLGHWSGLMVAILSVFVRASYELTMCVLIWDQIFMHINK